MTALVLARVRRLRLCRRALGGPLMVGLGLAAGVVFVLVGGEVRAAQRTLGPGGQARWLRPAVTLRVVPPVELSARGATELLAAAQAAALSWRTPCSAAEVRVQGAAPSRLAAGTDGESTITVLSQLWCRNGQRSKGCYLPGALAETVVGFGPGPERQPERRRSESGRGRGPAREGLSWIAEADIELNAVFYGWLGQERPKAPPVALEAVLAHELGHVLGFDDTCRPGTGACPEEPSIMAFGAHVGHLALRPTPADLASLCALYPRGLDPGVASQRAPNGPSSPSGGSRAPAAHGSPVGAPWPLEGRLSLAAGLAGASMLAAWVFRADAVRLGRLTRRLCVSVRPWRWRRAPPPAKAGP